MEEELRRERAAAIMFGQMEDSQDGLTKSQVHNAETRKGHPNSNVEYVESDVADVKASVGDVGQNVKVSKNGGKDVRTLMEDVESAVKTVNEVNTQLLPLDMTEWTKVNNTESGLRDVKTAPPHHDVQTKDVGLDVKDVDTGGDDVMKKDEDVESDKKGVNTRTTEEEAQVENIGSHLKPGAQTGQIDAQPNVKDAKSEENVKQGKADAQGTDQNVRSHVTRAKIGTPDAKMNVEYAEEDVKNYVKTKLKNAQLAMINKNVKSEVKEHKTKPEYMGVVGELDVSKKSENVRREVKIGKIAVLDERKTAKGFGYDSETRVRDVERKVEDVKIRIKGVETEINGATVKILKTGVTDVSTNGEKVRTDKKDGNIQVTCVEPKVKDVRSDLKDEIAGVTDLAVEKTEGGVGSDFRQVNEVGSDQKELGETKQKEKPEGNPFMIQNLNETLHLIFL